MTKKRITVTLSDVLPNWGQGKTRRKATDELLSNIVERYKDLLSSYTVLGKGLKEEVDFLRRLSTEISNIKTPEPTCQCDCGCHPQGCPSPVAYSDFSLPDIACLDCQMMCGAIKATV